MLAVKNTVLIIRLDCPQGIQQYWALIPPESGTESGTDQSAYQSSTIPHSSASSSLSASLSATTLSSASSLSATLSATLSSASVLSGTSVSASFQYSSWGRGGLDAETHSTERRSIKHMVRSLDFLQINHMYYSHLLPQLVSNNVY